MPLCVEGSEDLPVAGRFTSVHEFLKASPWVMPVDVDGNHFLVLNQKFKNFPVAFHCVKLKCICFLNWDKCFKFSYKMK